MNIEQQIQNIEKRNARVEIEKAWETSHSRIFSITLITYMVASGVLFVISNDNPFRNALIPAVGYFLSTQSLPFMKNLWIKRYLLCKKK